MEHHAATTETLQIRMEASGRVIANFAWQHLKAATTFRDHVIALEVKNTGQPLGPFFEDIRSYGSACVMSATASLEALINEIFIAHDGPLRKMFGDFESEFWAPDGIERKQILEKYQAALETLGHPRMDEHIPPFKDAWALIELRNALVHYKPTWDPERRRKVQLVDILSGKYELSPFVDDGADFVTMQSMSAGCTRWVTSAALRFMRAFNERAQIDEQKMNGFWKLDT